MNHHETCGVCHREICGCPKKDTMPEHKQPTLSEEFDALFKKYKASATKASTKLADILHSGQDLLNAMDDKVEQLEADDLFKEAHKHFTAVLKRISSEWNEDNLKEVASAPVEHKQLDKALALSNEGEFKKAMIELVDYLKNERK